MVRDIPRGSSARAAARRRACTRVCREHDGTSRRGFSSRSRASDSTRSAARTAHCSWEARMRSSRKYVARASHSAPLATHVSNPCGGTLKRTDIRIDRDHRRRRRARTSREGRSVMKRRAALGILLAVELFIGREARILRIAELSGLVIRNRIAGTRSFGARRMRSIHEKRLAWSFAFEPVVFGIGQKIDRAFDFRVIGLRDWSRERIAAV